MLMIALDLQTTARELLARLNPDESLAGTPVLARRYAWENKHALADLMEEVHRQASQPRSPLSSAG